MRTRQPADPLGSAPAPRASSSPAAAALRLQRLAGNRAVAAIARQRRPTAAPAVAPPARQPTATPAAQFPASGAATPPPSAGSSVVTRVVVVTTNDTLRVPVQGAGRASVPQQEVWRATARSLVRREPAPNGGRSVIIEAPDYSALEARLRALAAGGAHVSRMDFVGHGQPNGSIFRHAREREWLGERRRHRGARLDNRRRCRRASFEVNFRACYTDPVVPLLDQRLRRAGIPNPVVRGVSGAYQPRYGPPAGQTNVNDRRNWVIDDPGTNVSTTTSAPSVPASALQGL